MNENLCENCDNFMFTYTDIDKNLYNCCKQCGNKKSIDKINTYKTAESLDISNILNANTHLLSDKTLPKIDGNSNLKCINTECESNKGGKHRKITYYKYDEQNMYFLYSCDICNQKWRNISK